MEVRGLHLLLIFLLVWPIFAFNLNTRYPHTFYSSQRKNSSFGYSIAFYQKDNFIRLLVGAPIASAAYQCNLAEAISCSEMDVYARQSSEPNPWLGATVASRSGHALVCSPRYGSLNQGRCHHSQNLRSFLELAKGSDYSNAGISAAFSSNQIVVGAPSWNDNRGHILRTSLQTNRLDNIVPGRSFAYFSYAIAAGRISGQVEGIAVSSVFRANTLGLVNLVSLASPEPSSNGIEGQQSGEFFGNAVVMSDVSGDGLDDLIVGAPHYTDYDDPELKYEIGRVYLYLQSQSNVFASRPTRILLGRELGGRFGHSLAALGDINGDGFNDVAIGAPFEGDGKVYIFFGSGIGLRPEPGQVISGGPFGVRTFGFSLAGNVDVDGNGYKDVAVGAYQSDAVVYLPARPVVRMSALSLQFDPALISFDEPSFQCGGGRDAVCSTLTYCLEYEGRSVAQEMTFSVDISLDVEQSKSPRLFFDKDSTVLSERVTLGRERRRCWQKQVYVKNNVIDKLSPMEATMSIQLVSQEPAHLPPVLDPYGLDSTSNSIQFANNCGPDNECIPDLQLTVAMNDTSLVQGAKQYPAVKISVVNRGEDAFESYFNMYLPPSLLFKSSAGMLCSTPEDDRGPSLQCEIGNPLRSSGSAEFTVDLEPQLDVNNLNTSIEFVCQVTSKNKESNSTLHDNSVAVPLQLQVITALTVTSRPVGLLFNRTLFELNGKNEATLPPFVQDYEIINSGPSSILGANVTIDFVTKSREGLNVTSLTDEPRTKEGQGTCQMDQQPEASFAVITCQITEFSSSGRFIVSLRGRLADGIDQISLSEAISISSRFTAVVTRLPFGLDANQVAAASGVAKLIVTEESKASLLQAQVDWWIYAASAGGALLLLSAMSAALYKMGFFKRNRPPTADTDQLNDKNQENNEQET